jgi:hypothetical protein
MWGAFWGDMIGGARWLIKVKEFQKDHPFTPMDDTSFIHFMGFF